MNYLISVLFYFTSPTIATIMPTKECFFLELLQNNRPLSTNEVSELKEKEAEIPEILKNLKKPEAEKLANFLHGLHKNETQRLNTPFFKREIFDELKKFITPPSLSSISITTPPQQKQTALINFLELLNLNHSMNFKKVLDCDFSFLVDSQNLKILNTKSEIVIHAFSELVQMGNYGAACALFHKLKLLNDASQYQYFGKTSYQKFWHEIQKMALKEIEKRGSEGYLTFYNSCHTPLTWLFGNFYEGRFSYRNEIYKTTEAAFQAQKFLSNPKLPTNKRAEIIRAFKNADGDTAFKLGGKQSPFANYFNPNWEALKVEVMYEINLSKFNTDPFAQKALLATGNALLIENNERVGRDRFWSDNSDGKGTNMLGLILMDVRNELRKTPSKLRHNWSKTNPLSYPNLQYGYKNNGK